MSQTNPSRRSFLTTAAGAVAAPFILPGRIWSADAAPSAKIRMGFIGMGKQMGGLISRFLQYPEVEVVAVCDVYAMRRDLYKKKVDDHYAKNGGTGKPCASVNDFREITERGDIDAVCIATPDHWHAPISIAAVYSVLGDGTSASAYLGFANVDQDPWRHLVWCDPRFNLLDNAGGNSTLSL